MSSIDDKHNNPDPTRRRILGASAVLAGLAASTSSAQQAGPTNSAPPANSSRPGSWNQAPASKGADTNPGPKNPAVHNLNPDSWSPPKHDHGDVPNFKFSFSQAHNRRSSGGWAREVTVRDFPISTTIAGVNMRLGVGAIRELHWHLPAEWGYMLTGNARITGLTPNGKSYLADVGGGDLWYFPTGIPHSIQGLEPDGCEFLLVFDDGAFSEFSTFQITDWMAHVPPEVLSKNFGVPESTFNVLSPEELYIFPAPSPKSLADDKHATETLGEVDEPFSYRTLQQTPDRKDKSGEVRIIDSTRFKASKTIAAAIVTLYPGGLRELHWHPRADEWQYYIKGQGRMGIFQSGSLARTMDFQAGDVGYVPRSSGHYIENTGNENLEFMELFRDHIYQDISLMEWMANLPPELVEAHTHLPMSMIQSLPREKQVIVPS